MASLPSWAKHGRTPAKASSTASVDLQKTLLLVRMGFSLNLRVKPKLEKTSLPLAISTGWHCWACVLTVDRVSEPSRPVKVDILVECRFASVEPPGLEIRKRRFRQSDHQVS